MVSQDLQDAYLQVPIHHDLRRYLRFVVGERTYQFRVLCGGLTTAHRVFMRIMAPIILAYSELVTSVSRHGDSVFVFYGSTSSSTSQQSPATTRGVSVKPSPPAA